ncbi:hypothetical protein AAY473_035105 [Plecturocebus cupreus]
MVAHACNPSTLGGQDGRITTGHEFETSLDNIVVVIYPASANPKARQIKYMSSLQPILAPKVVNTGRKGTSEGCPPGKMPGQLWGLPVHSDPGWDCPVMRTAHNSDKVGCFIRVSKQEAPERGGFSAAHPPPPGTMALLSLPLSTFAPDCYYADGSRITLTSWVTELQLGSWCEEESSSKWHPPAQATKQWSGTLGSLRVAQAGLKLLNSSNPLGSDFQSAGIIGVSHRAQPCNFKSEIMSKLNIERKG